MTGYDEAFYQHQIQGSLSSASAVVPLVLELTGARSVIDVGCGMGTWLSVYRKHGVEDLLGLDGDYVDRARLLIDARHFRACDLSRPLGIDRRYDLVQSVEVAEHLAPALAQQFIDELVALGDVVLFSAAVPYQLGTGHVNEQYIDYWIQLFAQRGFQPADVLRPRLWDDDSIEVCYRQNMLLFANQRARAANRTLHEACANTNPHQLSIIHPGLYQPRIGRLLQTLADCAATVLGNGNFPLARALIERILDFDPANAQAWSLRGRLAAQTDELETAAVCLLRALEYDPRNPVHHYNLGQVYLAARQHAQAVEHFRRALALDPAHAPSRKALEALQGSGRS